MFVPAKRLIVRAKILMDDCLYNRESARREWAPIWGCFGGLWKAFGVPLKVVDTSQYASYAAFKRGREGL